MSRILSSSLPIARFVLQALIVLNILAGPRSSPCCRRPDREWIIAALKWAIIPMPSRSLGPPRGRRARRSLGRLQPFILKRLWRWSTPFAKAIRSSPRTPTGPGDRLFCSSSSCSASPLPRSAGHFEPGHESQLSAGFSLAGWLSSF